MARVFLSLLFILTAVGMASADEAKLGKDDFISSTISDVFDKVGKVTSGEERIIKDDYRSTDKGVGYTEPAGRPLEDPAIKPLKRPAKSQ